MNKNALRSQNRNKIFSDKSKTDRKSPILRYLFEEVDKKTIEERLC